MSQSEWKYYNNAVIPATPPHISPDTDVIESGKIWELFPNAYFARWTTDFDCGYNTEWYYTVRRTPFDINELKSKNRNEINRGNRNFYIKVINPTDYIDGLYKVHTEAVKAYPKETRIFPEKSEFRRYLEDISRNSHLKVYAAFLNDTDELASYLIIRYYTDYFAMVTLKSNPEYNVLRVNPAIVYGFLKDNAELLANGMYCSNGEKNINHETNFQDFLIKYFNFKKAYCKLNLAYNPKINGIVKMLYPIRKLLAFFDGVAIVHKVNSVLKMEEINRSQCK